MLEDSDRSLVERARQGDVEAYGEMVRRYQRSVYSSCYRLLGDPAEAEDLAQDAFLRAYGRLSRYDASRPFGPRVRKVAVNLCLNRLQHPSRRVLPLEEGLGLRDPDAAGDPAAAQERRETGEALWSALLALPQAYRAVVELRHFQGMSYAEIAQRLEWPLADVRSRLYRARRALADRLNNDA